MTFCSDILTKLNLGKCFEVLRKDTKGVSINGVELLRRIDSKDDVEGFRLTLAIDHDGVSLESHLDVLDHPIYPSLAPYITVWRSDDGSPLTVSEILSVFDISATSSGNTKGRYVSEIHPREDKRCPCLSVSVCQMDSLQTLVDNLVHEDVDSATAVSTLEEDKEEQYKRSQLLILQLSVNALVQPFGLAFYSIQKLYGP